MAVQGRLEGGAWREREGSVPSQARLGLGVKGGPLGSVR